MENSQRQPKMFCPRMLSQLALFLHVRTNLKNDFFIGHVNEHRKHRKMNMGKLPGKWLSIRTTQHFLFSYSRGSLYRPSGVYLIGRIPSIVHSCYSQLPEISLNFSRSGVIQQPTGMETWLTHPHDFCSHRNIWHQVRKLSIGHDQCTHFPRIRNINSQGYVI